MKQYKTLTKYVIGALSLLGTAALIFQLATTIAGLPATAQDAPQEPNCSNWASTAAWNSFSNITTSQPNPSFNNNNCEDMPLLSFFPINTSAGNPRTRDIIENETFSIHAYYVNGANPASNSVISNPNIGVAVRRISETQYQITSQLSSSNAGTRTSAQEGGDLIVNVPAGTQLELIGNNTLHYPEAVQRQYEADTTGRNPFDRVTDNSTNGIVSNPVLTELTGFNLPSTSGYNFDADGLEPGFLHYGYFLMQFSAQAADVNQPPQIPGEEITIVRGESGSFERLNPTDPENDTPIELEFTNFPDFCTRNEATLIITCNSDENTPVRSIFTITPTDSRGAVGTSGEFIVNIIEPNLPPVLTGQEILIIRGESGSFNQFTAVDPENDTPIDYAFTDFLDFCNLEESTRIITCDTDQDTPERSEFYITPTDSRGNEGNRATFVVRVIEPGLSLQKLCNLKSNNLPCESTTVNIGDEIIYTLNVRNSGTAPARNVTVVDDYDQTRIQDITAINPAGDHDTTNGTISWSLGDIESNDSRQLTFEATVSEGLSTGEIIVNTATAQGDGIPPITVDNEFPVVVPNTASLQTSKSCVKVGTGTNCASASLKPGERVLYTVTARNTGDVDLTQVTIVDDYDQSTLTNITNIDPAGTDNGDTITWNVGTMLPGQETIVTFQATIQDGVASGTVIRNIATIATEELPEQTVNADFPVNVVGTNPETPRTGGALVIGLLGASGSLGGLGYYFYNRSQTNKASEDFQGKRKKSTLERIFGKKNR